MDLEDLDNLVHRRNLEDRMGLVDHRDLDILADRMDLDIPMGRMDLVDHHDRHNRGDQEHQLYLEYLVDLEDQDILVGLVVPLDLDLLVVVRIL